MSPRTIHSEEVKTDGAALPATSPQTLGQMILDVARRHQGLALQSQRDGRTRIHLLFRARHDLQRDRARAHRPRHRARRPCRDTGPDLGRLDVGRLRGMVRRRGRGADLPHQLPGECAHVLVDSGARLVFCEDAAQAAKIEQIRDRCPALEHVVFFQAPCRRRDRRSTSCAVGARKCLPTAVAERLAQVSRRRSRDARVHVGHDRTPEGLHAHPHQFPGDDADVRASSCTSTRRTRSTSSSRSPTSSRGSLRWWR